MRDFDIIAEFSGLTIIHQKLPGNEVDRHQHSLHEFFLPLQGEIAVEYENHNIKAGPGRILYIPPDIEHKFSSAGKGSGERVIWLIDDKVWKRQITTSFEACVFPMNSLVKELVFYLLIHPEINGVKYFVSVLVESQLTITDISLEVGYNSLSKFIAVFKKHEGILPSDFRKLRLKR